MAIYSKGPLRVWGFLLICSTLIGGLDSSVSADLIYSYTGNHFTDIGDFSPPAGSYNTSMSVSGWFTLANALPVNLSSAVILPVTFSFFDGRNSLSHTSSLSAQSFYVWTDTAGNLVDWQITLTSPLGTPSFGELNRFPLIQDSGYTTWVFKHSETPIREGHGTVRVPGPFRQFLNHHLS